MSWITYFNSEKDVGEIDENTDFSSFIEETLVLFLYFLL